MAGVSNGILTTRWLRFSLRACFFAATWIAVGLAWLFHGVSQRRTERARIERLGGFVSTFQRPESIDLGIGLQYSSYQRVHGPENEPEIPRWRRWLGDEAYNQIALPAGTSEAEADRMRALFPESQVEVNSAPSSGSGFFY